MSSEMIARIMHVPMCLRGSCEGIYISDIYEEGESLSRSISTLRSTNSLLIVQQISHYFS